MLVIGETIELEKKSYNAMSKVHVREAILKIKLTLLNVLRAIKEYCVKTVFMTRLLISNI